MPVLIKNSTMKPIRPKSITTKKKTTYEHDSDYVYQTTSEDEEEYDYTTNDSEEEEYEPSINLTKKTSKRKVIQEEEEGIVVKKRIKPIQIDIVNDKKEEMKQNDEMDVEDVDMDDDYYEDEYYNGIDEYQLESLEKDNPELYKKFTEVREHLVSELPTIEKILETNMDLKDRAHIVELFEMFCVETPLTMEWMELKEQIRVAMEKAVTKYKVKEILEEDVKQKIEMEVKKLKTISAQEEDTYEHTIALMKLPLEYKKIIYRKFLMVENAYEINDEISKVMEWLSVITKIPFGIYLRIPGENVIMDLKYRLDKEFYGMEQVKEQLLIYVSNKLYNPEIKSYPLGLIGPPGTAKTSIALAISKALQFPFEQLSGGGLTHTDGIHGHSFTYIGAQCGDITKALIRMNCLNGILFIDEFDKLANEKNMNSLLQLIDPVQNHHFKDNYVGEIPIDLSHIWFMLSMNVIPENQALQDRIYCIQLNGYSEQDKLNIMRHNIVPNLLSKHQLNDIGIHDDVLYYIIRNTDGEGMRQCIHMLTNLLCKIVFTIRHPDIPTTFNKTRLTDNIIRLEMVKDWLKNSRTEQSFHTMYM